MVKVKTKQSKTSNTEDLLSKAMLVRFSTSCWGAKKNDSEVAEEVATKHKSDSSLGKFTKSLLKSEARNEYRKVCREAYALHRRFTLPWDEGVGLLPASMFWKYNEEMEVLKRKAEELANEFVKEYRAEWSGGLAQYKKALGDLFNAEDYPEPDQVKAKFGIRIRVQPLTNPNDFRVQLGNGTTDTVKQQMMDDLKADLSEALKAPWERLHKAVVKIHTRLADSDAVFRDTLIDNVKELIEILPALNVTGDPELTRLINSVKKDLCVDDVKALRKDEKFRAEVAKNAADILAGMKGYVS